MSSSWRRYEVLLPTRFNDSREVPGDWLAEAVLEIVGRFGAASASTVVVIWSVGLALAGAAPARSQPARAAVRSPVGINVAGLQAYTTAFPIIDVFKASGPWISGTRDVWDDGRPIDVDKDGWVRSLLPGQVVHTVLIDRGTRAPAGRYTVTYEGEGQIEYQEGARLVQHAPGRDLIEMVPSEGNCYLDIVSVDPANPLRNIRVLLPGANAGQTFNPAWVDRIRGFTNLRFGCWIMGDNPESVGQVTWDERPRIGHARWSTGGVPAEVMIDLANTIGADPWITIPHQSDDGYVRGFARLVRERLSPQRKIYVEHSNEVWNDTFTSHGFATKRGLALALSADPDEARARYHSRRSREIWALFDEALGPDRVVNVLAAQTDSPSIAEQLLAYEDTARRTDALAIGAYFGYELGLPVAALRVRKMTLGELFRELETVELPKTMRFVRENAAIAARHSVPLIAYEGGQHLSPVLTGVDDPAIDALFDAANRDNRMGRLYTRLLEEWSAASGGGLFSFLNECDRMGPYGRWGLLEFIDQPRVAAPKYDAVIRWMAGAR